MDAVNPQAPILIVDDEEQILQSVSVTLAMAGYRNIGTCSDSRQVESLIRETHYAAVTLDLYMPYIDGIAVLDQVQTYAPDIPVIVVTGINEIDTAIDCMKKGAFDYLVKPVDKTRLLTAIRNAVQASDIRRENEKLTATILADSLENPARFSAIITRSPSMTAIFRYVEAIAGTNLPILITGETGVGKELLAGAIHACSDRDGPFVAVNIAGLDDTLFSDTLFGHVRGAYTGADSDREGMIAKAAGGTLFLDEIGDLSKESQIKLLRLLQEREYYPLGTDTSRATDARFVFASNHDLEVAANSDILRRDLYYRLRSHRIHLPPLRDRPADTRPLINHFLQKAAKDMGREVPSLPDSLFTFLRGYDFPGNVRELEGMVYDALVRHTSGQFSMESFHKAQGLDARSQVNITAYEGQQNPFSTMEGLPTLGKASELLIDEALRRSDGNQGIAADLVGLSRSALNKRLKRSEG